MFFYLIIGELTDANRKTIENIFSFSKTGLDFMYEQRDVLQKAGCANELVSIV